ncbi:MT-A70 family methyltransferase [Elizabethkingia anophelis]|nr:MT-A70 family methyltransferase [Elizabethkingia anophelis]
MSSEEITKYEIIYADPPWQYRVLSKKDAGRTAESHYQTVTPDFLKKMDIPVLSKPDCVLFMWATFPCLQQALELGETWGFNYKTIAFVWIKTNMKDDRIFIGMGHYTRANAEVVLLFTKGKSLKRHARNVSQVLISPRRRHSGKPDEIRERIKKLFGDVSRLELFAREFDDGEHNFDGWDVFGNEVENSITIPDF